MQISLSSRLEQPADLVRVRVRGRVRGRVRVRVGPRERAPVLLGVLVETVPLPVVRARVVGVVPPRVHLAVRGHGVPG